MTAHPLDVLCIGHASYDLVFSVPHHPGADEKIVADDLLGCGGGPAANAAVTVSKLGGKAGFCGYLGNDVYGDSHLRELQDHGVDTQLIVRGISPTPLSTVLVKPNGQRALINYKGQTSALPATAIDFDDLAAKVLLFDGHEPHISLRLLNQLSHPVPTVLDAGSLHDGTQALMTNVDYLVCSEKFALQYASDENLALSKLAQIAPVVVITLGERGLIWQRGQERGSLNAPPIVAIDTTGAGDAFHGAFAAGLAKGLSWAELLRYASVAGAFCCTEMGARPGLPSFSEHQELLTSWSVNGESK
ncbi:carbohydrate kinase [Methylomonas sp. EFPC1]|uniref:carbohydrate kinase family protein n=1 Tax=unclassified Methylomonas TaxID=2608980 RepID=UPI000C325DAF|nr:MULTISPECIES: PfkB family carbohydrate kinase [unclassified Methylomonas]PKD38115.1 carbohydrate kinase [Methylomonas sp. Kb3]QSB03049.1 carbohydrate kinase [Methylomonas sp. EFPC1]